MITARERQPVQGPQHDLTTRLGSVWRRVGHEQGVIVAPAEDACHALRITPFLPGPRDVPPQREQR